jgi:hypothetical protein
MDTTRPVTGFGKRDSSSARLADSDATRERTKVPTVIGFMAEGGKVDGREADPEDADSQPSYRRLGWETSDPVEHPRARAVASEMKRGAWSDDQVKAWLADLRKKLFGEGR